MESLAGRARPLPSINMLHPRRVHRRQGAWEANKPAHPGQPGEASRAGALS